jgi:hypothetical protein
MRAVLLHQFRRRFGNQVNDAIEQKVMAASLRRLETWIDRILFAASLTELLGD